jgi:hypothetical protein
MLSFGLCDQLDKDCLAVLVSATQKISLVNVIICLVLKIRLVWLKAITLSSTHCIYTLIKEMDYLMKLHETNRQTGKQTNKQTNKQTKTSG